jgi:hypothetical protein
MERARPWLLRAFLLLPAYWVLRDAIRPRAGAYVGLVVVPWAALVLASWLAATRLLDPRQGRLRLGLAGVATICGWGVLHIGRMATRVVLVPALVAAAACVAPPLAVATASLVVTLAALELAIRLHPGLLPVDARLVLPLGTRERLACFFRTPDGCLPADALQVYPLDLAFAYKPNLNVVLWHPESGFWTLRTDDHGFANVDSTLHDRADVVVLGDSFMQGVLVEPEESFPARLAAQTGRRVLNLGIPGWDAYQYPIALRRYGLAARPRVVIAGIFGTNDWNARFPLFARYRIEHPDADYRDFLDAQARERRTPGTTGLFGLPERLYAQAFLPAAVAALVHPHHVGAAAGRDYEELTLGGQPVRLPLADALRLWRAIDPERLMEDHRLGIEQLGRSIDELRTLAAGAGARLVVLYVPTMEEVYLPLVAPESQIWGPTPKARVLDKFARLRAVVTSLVRPAELLDLTAPLGEVARAGASLYWIHDPHWNRRGYAAVASIVARHLRLERARD